LLSTTPIRGRKKGDYSTVDPGVSRSPLLYEVIAFNLLVDEDTNAALESLIDANLPFVALELEYVTGKKKAKPSQPERGAHST